jgi:hypothetical protein
MTEWQILKLDPKCIIKLENRIERGIYW